MTRCIEGADKLDFTAREVLRRMIWKVAEFCGVEIVTYALMPNHFHVLVHVPKREPIPDEEILRRYKLLHPKPSPYQIARIEVLSDWLKRNTPEGIAWRTQQLALMHDISAFMKLLKQRFSHWFNATHKRFGTLWAERFKSVLVELNPHTLRTMAAYIDLNAVRKGLVADPKDYRWCGYAEAVAGSKLARRGLHLVCPHPTWSKAQADYRCILYGVGASPRENKIQIDDKAFRSVMAAEGQLSLAELLRHRWRYFTEGRLLGSANFVNAHQSPPLPAKTPSLSSTARPPSSTSPQKPRPPRPHPTPWGGWTTPRRVNNRPKNLASPPSPSA